MRLTMRLAALALAGVAAALVAAEAGLRLARSPETRYMVWPPGLRHVMRPDPILLPGITGAKRLTINSLGLRGREPGPDGEYRLLVVGGSTAELIYLDDSETWMQRLEDSLGAVRPAWVPSAGRSGMTARDHVLHLRYLTAPPPRIDAVLVLVGVNDLVAALAAGGAYRRPASLDDPAAEYLQAIRAFAVIPDARRRAGPPPQPWFKRFALYDLAHRVRLAWDVRREGEGLRQDEQGRNVERWRSHRRAAPARMDALPPLDAALAEYRADLELMAAEARSRGLRLVLATQPALWRADLAPAEEARLWMGGVGEFQREPGHPYYGARALRAGMDRFNAELLGVCARQQLECVDLAARLPRDTVTFYDDVHFTERGAAAVASVLAGWFRARPPFAAGPQLTPRRPAP